MEEKAISSAMTNLKNMTKSQQLSSDCPCNICGGNGKPAIIDGHKGYLCMEEECLERAAKRVEKKKKTLGEEFIEKDLERSGMPPKYLNIECDKNYMHLVQDKGVFIHGSAGTGKTVMACSIGKKHISHSKRLKFKSVPKMVVQLQSCFNSNGPEEMLENLSSVNVLILDDLGAEKMTDFVRQSLYYLINEREQWDRTTIITSNYSLAEIGKNLDSRLSSRIAGMCKVVNLQGKDRRITQGIGNIPPEAK